MAERVEPKVYSIAAHRGFADALVAGLVPRYLDPDLGLAKLTLLMPSSRAARTVSEAFLRYAGDHGIDGLLLPRMVMIGDAELGESLGMLLDPMDGPDIAPAVSPTRRWLELARLIEQAHIMNARDVPIGTALLRMAREMAATFDRLIAEEVAPQALLSDKVKDRFPEISKHWQDNLWLFATVQKLWDAYLEGIGEIDLATRRNALFDWTSRHWREQPPATPVVAAGITSAAPALARLLRVIADLPHGAVIMPDLDLRMSDEAWQELGLAGQSERDEGDSFTPHEASTHPQYHLKLLLGRMGINRGEVDQWHRRGAAAAPPERSRAISSLFLPPKASKVWVDLEAKDRKLAGVRMMELPTVEDEAQSIALLIRQALEESEKRVSLITPDRGLARRVVGHLKRWNVDADDTAGQLLNLTTAGRLLLQIAEVLGDGGTPVSLIAMLSHPLVKRGEARGEWLLALRKFELELRGPLPAPGLLNLRAAAQKCGVADWWEDVEELLAQLLQSAEHEEQSVADLLAVIVECAQELAGDGLWANHDGRALASFTEDLAHYAAASKTRLAPREIHTVLRDAMEQIAVRPPYGGHPRVSVYGLLESRMSRSDLVICGGLNEGVWPQIPTPDPLLAPAILRALGVPGADFRIGLAAHDLAAAMGAPEVVLTRSQRDGDGPTIPSRFLLRVKALLGNLGAEHSDVQIPQWTKWLSRSAPAAPRYPRPEPKPTAAQRDVNIKVTALDRLLGDPYQFYAQEILKLKEIDALDAEAGPAWQGTIAHTILDRWHKQTDSNGDKNALKSIADQVLTENNVHPLLWGLWRPRLHLALEWVADEIAATPDRSVLDTEIDGKMSFEGVTVYGRADRIDRLGDGSLAIVDYKTGTPPSAARVKAGFALQLGLLGMIAEDGGFQGVTGAAQGFEYWSLARQKGGKAFGYVSSPVKKTERQSGLLQEDFIPAHADYLSSAISRFIKGDAPFTARLNPDFPGYNTYDQLMRLDEWERNFSEEEGGQ